MRVLVACEYSGTVRDAFTAAGCDAMSCDLLPSETPGKHYQGDVRDVIDSSFDLMVAHPPCTHLAVSGARWFTEGKKPWAWQEEALDFVRLLMAAPIPHICIENPVSVISSKIRKPDQIVQPWQFGHLETKKTCLWLKNLPALEPTANVYDEMMSLTPQERERVWRMAPGPDRQKERTLSLFHRHRISDGLSVASLHPRNLTCLLHLHLNVSPSAVRTPSRTER